MHIVVGVINDIQQRNCKFVSLIRNVAKVISVEMI